MQRPLSRGVVLWASLLAASGPASRPAAAGPAKYDPETRSFRLTYTCANLPPGQIGSTREATPAQPTAEQEATIRKWLADADPLLSRITSGRAGGRPDFVKEIRDADIIFSLTGQPDSAAWAALAAIEGRPGHCVFYYQSLVILDGDDALLNIVHHYGHYLFGLADEYAPADFPGGCPLGPGPGCLMDNYNAAVRGWMGRLCDSTNHNSQPKQPDSCQEIVDRFFAARGDPAKVLRPEDEAAQVREEVFSRVTALMRQGGIESVSGNSPPGLTDQALQIYRELATKRALRLTAEELDKDAQQIVRSVWERLRQEERGRIDDQLLERLRDKAAELAARYPRGTYAPATRQTLLRKDLQVLALESLVGTLTPAERRFLEKVVREVVPAGEPSPRPGPPTPRPR